MSLACPFCSRMMIWNQNTKISLAPLTAVQHYAGAASFGVYNRPKAIALAALAILTVFVFFAIFPQADIAVSNLFFDAETCGKTGICGAFPAAVDTKFSVLRAVFYAMPFMVLFGIIAFNVADQIKQKRSLWRDAPVVGALIASLIVGPGLLVNAFLKEVVLRSRPRDVTLFGGDFPFVPVGQLSGMCSSNCSFVSGEASIAPFLILSVLLFPKAMQRSAFLILLPASLAMAFLRVVVGAHYMSDVMLGYVSTIFVFSILAFFASKILAKTSAQNSSDGLMNLFNP